MAKPTRPHKPTPADTQPLEHAIPFFTNKIKNGMSIISDILMDRYHAEFNFDEIKLMNSQLSLRDFIKSRIEIELNNPLPATTTPSDDVHTPRFIRRQDAELYHISLLVPSNLSRRLLVDILNEKLATDADNTPVKSENIMRYNLNPREQEVVNILQHGIQFQSIHIPLTALPLDTLSRLQHKQVAPSQSGVLGSAL